MEYLPAFGHLVKNHQKQDSPPLERMEDSTPEDGEVLLPRISRIGRIVSYARLGAKQKQDKPLGEDGGRCPAGYSDFSTTDLTDWTDCFLCGTASKTKTQ